MRSRAALALVLAALLFGAKLRLDDRRTADAQLAPFDIGVVPRASAVRWLSLGHTTLAANLWWLRIVQYIGEPRAAARGWDKLFPALDLVTDLDPRHGYAYQVGGNVLAAEGRIAESNRILEKGCDRLPERYILPFHRGVNAFLYAGDYAEAGRWFERSAKSPGAPPHMREAVMAMYVKGNQADTAIQFLQAMIASSRDDESRKALESQLQQAYLERAALPMDEAALAFHERHQRWPQSPRELVEDGLLAAIPADPFGGAWRLDDDGRWHSTAHDRRLLRPMSETERRRAILHLDRQLGGGHVP